MKNFRTTWILLSVAAVLAVTVWWSQRNAPKEVGDATIQVVAIKGDSIQSLRFARPGDPTVTVERQNERWQLTSPLQWQADIAVMPVLLERLQDLQAVSKFDNPEEAAAYGLDKPSLVLTVLTADGETVLELGGVSPVGSERYARVASQQTVFLLDAETASILDLSLSQLRDKRLVDAAPLEVQRMTLRGTGGTMAAVQRLADKWQVVAPFSDRADDDVINELVFAFSFLQATDFVEKPGKLGTYGLDKPVLQIELVTGTPPQEKTHRITMGQAPGEKKKYSWETPTYYVASSTHPSTVYKLELDLEELLTLKADDLIAIFIFDPAVQSNTQQLRMTTPNGNWTLQRVGQEWQLSQPGKSNVPVSKVYVDNLFSKVREVALGDIAQKGTKTLPQGGERWTLQLTTTDRIVVSLQARLATVDTEWLATVDGRPHRYRINGALLRAVQTAFQDLTIEGVGR